MLVIEDGSTITHGGMAYGASYVAALAAGAAEIVDLHPSVDAAFAKIYQAYPHIGKVLPVLGYESAQLQALEHTINTVDADIPISASSIDLTHLLWINKRIVRARYEFAQTGEPTLCKHSLKESKCR